ncbi:MAG TPA: efflux RND transporter periplasmic adaptor subunit [Bryobacteraceae bacterium]|jgi:HlyD family secretion protein|nr:efflux RND transporter periplasmic adaptor subunit [Bryobacteraceae bacterium]
MNESGTSKAAAVSDPPRTGRQDGVPPATGKQKRFIRLLVIALIAIAGFFIWRQFIATPAVPDNIVQLSGRIEGDDSAVAPKTSGRIVEVRVREGDEVKAGEIIALLDDQQVKAREEQARAALAAAEARSASAKVQVSVLEEQLQGNELQTEQAQVDSAGRVRQAEADLAAAEADLAQQQASYQIALFDKDAYTRLAKTGAVSERQGKQSESTANQQAAAVAAAQKRVDAANGALTTAKANLSNPSIRRSAASAVRRQIAQQQAEIASAAANAEESKFQLEEAEANRQDLTITAPFDGTVITRAAEPGEVVTAGTAIVTLLDLRKVYLRGFVPEGQIGKVKIGQAARVYLDSHPDRAIEAYVLRIDPQATFTPENTYFRDDRVKQVVGVKLQLKGAVGFAKPGMPADGEVLVQGDNWPGHRTK